MRWPGFRRAPRRRPVAPQRIRPLGRGVGSVAGPPVVAGALSGIQAIALRSYLNPGALLRASFVVFMTAHHLLLSLVLKETAVNGTATSFSPMPRKPPAPTIRATILPSLST